MGTYAPDGFNPSDAWHGQIHDLWCQLKMFFVGLLASSNLCDRRVIRLLKEQSTTLAHDLVVVH